MSETPKPKRTRAKTTGSTAGADSEAATPDEPRATGAVGNATTAASRPASDAAPETDNSHGQTSQSTQSTTPAGTQETGNVPDPSKVDGASGYDARTHARETAKRLQKDGVWFGKAELTRNDLMADAKRRGLDSEAAQAWTYGELDRLYPPILIDPKAQHVALLKNESPQVDTSNDLRRNSETPPLRDGGVKGLGDIPPGWPPLPANAVLSAELGWVQANRLYVVEELASGGTRVHLDMAHEPAPSRAAIGWLETSIRSYAKYVEVCAKVTGSGDEDSEQVKRERLAIEEIRELLREMAGNPPGPGR